MFTEIDFEAFVEFEADGYSRVADEYDRCFGSLTTRTADELLDAAGVGRGSRVLDVGTGPGYVAARAAARGASVLGVDVSSGCIDLARRLRPDLEFRQGDAHRLSLPDASFDAAVANFLMPHLADHARAAAELTRVLVDDGRIALSTWDLPERSPFPGALFLAVGQAGAPMAEGVPPGPPFFRYADDAAFAELLSDAGLVDVTVTDLAFTHRMPSADAFWDAMLGGTVRASAQVRGQTPDMQRSIRRAFDRIVAHYYSGGELELPVSVKIAAGRKASR
ncbi:MAG TPA: methyltransferase domain-containing protein [Acidimicrobiales bacterium]|nr:methyltransferase domain-containing protein [Acidimicrobiales bacterium]